MWTMAHQLRVAWPPGGKHLKEALRVLATERQPRRDLLIDALLLKDLQRRD